MRALQNAMLFFFYIRYNINMYGYIYKTTNLINGLIYIGQHKAKVKSATYIGSGKILWQAIRKFGIENFKNEVLEWCETAEELNEREIYWIEKLNARTKGIGYNLALGGHSQKMYKRGEMPIEQRQRISNKLKGHTLSKESIEKMRATRRANPRVMLHTNEAKKKISDNVKDRISIHKDDVEKRIYQHELQLYINDGWELGGRKRNRKSSLPHVWITDGMTSHFITIDKAEQFIATGIWRYGALQKQHKRGYHCKKHKTRSDKGIPRKKHNKESYTSSINISQNDSDELESTN